MLPLRCETLSADPWATSTSGSPTEFHYQERPRPPGDARMQRFAIDWAGTLSYYLWDGMNQLVEKDASLSTVAEHTHGATPIEGIGSVIVTKRSGAPDAYQYPHYDHRGSLFNLEDTGAGVEDLVCEFNAFGEELRRTGSAVTRFGYQGTAWMRHNSALLVSPRRLYVPGMGRFGQIDLLRADLNRYLYALLSPAAFVDVNGMDEIDLLAIRAEYQRMLEEHGPEGPTYPEALVDRFRYLKRYSRIKKEWKNKGAFWEIPLPEADWGPDEYGDCDQKPATMTYFRRIDKKPPWGASLAVFEVEHDLTCAKGIDIRWSTCRRGWDPEVGGYYERCRGGPDNLECLVPLGELTDDTNLTEAHIRFLSCENGLWEPKGSLSLSGRLEYRAFMSYDHDRFWGTWSVRRPQ